MTDYQAIGYARRFARARSLDDSIHAVWVQRLRQRAGGATLGTVLDLGAGTGRFWPVIREAWHADRIIAIDKSSSMLAFAGRSPDVRAAVGDIDALPGGVGPVDACLCSMVLHYSREPAAVCRRLYDVVRPDGLVCIRTATQTTIGTLAFVRYFPTAAAAERAVMPQTEEVLAWLTAAGFTRVEAEHVETVPAGGYASYLRRIALRGIPSLQLVPRAEFLWGLVRLAVGCALRRGRGLPVPAEQTLLVTAVRP